MSDFPYLKALVSAEDMAFRKLIREFVDKEIMPVRALIDDDDNHLVVRRILEELVKLGIQKGAFPKEYGGLGGSPVTSVAIMHEEIGRGDSGIGAAATVTTRAWLPAIIAGNKAVLDAFARDFCGDQLRMACFAITEPGGDHGGGGCDIENPVLKGRKIRTIARLEGNEWVITGQKAWASNSGAADLYCVLCTTDPDLGDDGVALIYVPKDAAGLGFGKFEKKVGMQGDRNCMMFLDDVRVPKEYRAAGPGRDAELFRNSVVLARILAAALAVGNAQGAFETVLQYSGERIVADKPIRQHSICAGMLADMAIGIETARMYYLAAAHMYDRPELCGPPVSDMTMSRASIAKVYAADVAVMVTNKAMELMGSYGCVREYNVEKYWRDCKIIQLWEGGGQLGRFDVCRGFYDCAL